LKLRFIIFQSTDLSVIYHMSTSPKNKTMSKNDNISKSDEKIIITKPRLNSSSAQELLNPYLQDDIKTTSPKDKRRHVKQKSKHTRYDATTAFMLAPYSN